MSQDNKLPNVTLMTDCCIVTNSVNTDGETNKHTEISIDLNPIHYVGEV